MERQEYFDIVTEIFELHKAKGGDYGTEQKYFPFDDKSYIQMLHVKTQRLISLVQNGGTPNFESLEDTAKDLILYGIFYLGHLKRLPA